VFWHRTDARHLVYIRYIKGLDATVVKNAPNFDHTFGISSYKTVKRTKTVDPDQRLLMTIQFHDFLFQVRIPYKNFEVKTARHNDLVLFTIGYFTHRLIVARKSLNGLFSEIFKKFIGNFCTKILFDLGVLFLLGIDWFFIIFGCLI